MSEIVQPPAPVADSPPPPALAPTEPDPLLSDDPSVQLIVDNVIERLMKQERELEKLELKCRAYERIFKQNREKLKSSLNSIDEQQNASQIQAGSTASTGSPANATPIKRYTLRKFDSESGRSLEK